MCEKYACSVQILTCKVSNDRGLDVEKRMTAGQKGDM